MEEQLLKALDRFLNEDLEKLVLSNPREKEGTFKIQIRPVSIQGTLKFQAEEFAGKQAFHKNLEPNQAKCYIAEQLSRQFKQMELKSSQGSVQALVSKKGKMTVKVKNNPAAANSPSVKIAAPSRKEKLAALSHNRSKHYIIEEGTPVPFLADLGVMTAEGKIVRSRYDKFRQINRFLEFIEDVLPRLDKSRENVIIDFGCGKSYLTFAMYYYLKVRMGYPIRIIGLDLKKDVIKNCSRLAVKYGYDKLNFYEGSIEEFEGVTQVDMVVTLHACDTATDYALYKALRWGASVILSVPCCQHELNKQISVSELEPITDYGILKERFCALATDGIRAKILEEQGYDTQILEFIDMEHTPKNLLIRAVKNENKKKDIQQQEKWEACAKAFHAEPTLQTLLFEK